MWWDKKKKKRKEVKLAPFGGKKKGERACVTDLFGNERGNTRGSGDVGGGAQRGWGNEETRQTTWHRLHRFCFGERKLWSDAKGNLFLNVKFHTSGSAAPARGSLKWQHGGWLVVPSTRKKKKAHFHTQFGNSGMFAFRHVLFFQPEPENRSDVVEVLWFEQGLFLFF